MGAGESEGRPGMGESRRRIPCGLRVAVGATGSEPGVVRIDVTGSARSRETEEGSIQILHLDFSARGGWDLFLIVAALAG